MQQGPTSFLLLSGAVPFSGASWGNFRIPFHFPGQIPKAAIRKGPSQARRGRSRTKPSAWRASELRLCGAGRNPRSLAAAVGRQKLVRIEKWIKIIRL